MVAEFLALYLFYIFDVNQLLYVIVCAQSLLVTLFQVFNTYSNEDYDRRNEEVDPVASSAEYELEKRVEKLELFPVELEKGGKENLRMLYHTP